MVTMVKRRVHKRGNTLQNYSFNKETPTIALHKDLFQQITPYSCTVLGLVSKTSDV
jgi:hypothetical protein